MGTEINELYNALQRFIERRQKMHIPLEQDDDDVIIANAFDELEQLRAENKRLREENAKFRAEQVCHGDQCKLEEIKAVEKNADYWADEARRLRGLIDGALIDVGMVRDGAEDWIEFVEEKLRQALEGGGE